MAMMIDFSNDPRSRLLALDMHSSRLAALPVGVVETARIADLDAALMAWVKPDNVMVPLVSQNHDAMAVVEQLEALGYRGLITVLAVRLPNAAMVEAELRALGPGTRLTLLTT